MFSGAGIVAGCRRTATLVRHFERSVIVARSSQVVYLDKNLVLETFNKRNRDNDWDEEEFRESTTFFDEEGDDSSEDGEDTVEHETDV